MKRGEKMKSLKQRRLNLKLTQMDLAKEVGVSLLTIQLWEREISSPNESNRQILESVLQRLEKQKEVK
jgi:DNA-binding XRE family transcriptional regulator